MAKLFVDDIRDAPNDTWAVARKVESAIRAIAQFSPTIISIDHDIENRPSDETFKPVAYFLGEKYNNHHGDYWASELVVIIHSVNPVGAKEIQAILNDYGILKVRIEPYARPPYKS